MLQLCTIYACANGTLGLNLSRAPWDPYPWVSGVQEKSNAERGGICIGDTLLELNGVDILGLRISELAKRLQEHWQSGAECVTMMMWRQQSTANLTTAEDAAEAEHAVQHGINQQSLQKFATCLQHIAQLLECPVCLEVIKPPGWQCCNGHVLCNNCRSRSVKCPVCRVPLGPRGRCLLSDKLFTLLAENFPCDGVKSNQVMAQGGVNKCTNEYHNQPKMALALAKSNSCKKSGKISGEAAVHVVVNGQEGAPEQRECLGEQMPKGNEQNARMRNNVSNRTIKMQRQADSQENYSNNMLVKPKLKLSKKSWQITGQDQDELRSNEVANINNGQQQQQTMTTRMKQEQKMMLGQEQKQEQEQEQVMQTAVKGRGQLQYQNYHCPTGKSCSNAKLKLCHQHPTVTATETATTNNKLSTVRDGDGDGGVVVSAATEIAFAPLSGGGGGGSNSRLSAESHTLVDTTLTQTSGGSSIKSCEWQLLRHLSSEHNLAVLHFYGTFGQRMHVPLHWPNLACLSLSLGENDNNDLDLSPANVKVHTFFLAVIPIRSRDDNDDCAVFLWHLNSMDQQPVQFETVIEAAGERLKWFGPAHSLTRSWPDIESTGEYLKTNNCTAFDITVKRKH
ncbi:uncharacterized protein Dwil_GK11612 [Drosophila willistoni]|uniref:RING-type domain-containing protein n=1 Tax=Drosophila willistoni TaxID=7260 RepID=B4N9F9_DROWI|nr:uncharacterized protein LOC6647749 [Drosophila willistoni]EDW80592.2 uncharacterized protein Dwil_GK11612 [Drosophila willistoni]